MLDSKSSGIDSYQGMYGSGLSARRSDWRSTRVVRHAMALLALIVIAVLMLGANPIVGETIAPFDMLSRVPGWKNTGIDGAVKHLKHSDVLDNKLPSWRFARDQLRNGELPLWNPLVLGGEPLVLLITRSILTPAFALYAAIDDESIGLYAAALINLIIISVGSYLLLFTLSGNRLAALLGAVVFSYSGFIASWFLWHHVNTAIWIPWVLYFAVRVLQTSDFRHIPRLALASTMMILGGFPTVAVYGYLALLLLLLCWALFSRSPVGRVLALGSGVASGLFLSLLLSAVVLYCLDESLGRLNLDYRRGGSAFHSLQHLMLFVRPFSDGPLTLGRTGYVGILPLLLFLPALWLSWKNTVDWRFVWGVSMIVIIAPLAFAWIPMDYIRHIPLIGSSMISRLILLIGLGFAVITTLVSVAGYDRLIKRVPWLANVILLLLLLIQVFDQRQVFQSLVGYVKAEAIYPTTPMIDQARSDIEPLQSVISDRGFLVPGVLSAYGLAEWFAHGFHGQAEKRLLKGAVDRPFVTPTAANFLCGQVRFDKQILTYMGIKYVLCSRRPEREAKLKHRLSFDTMPKETGKLILVDLAKQKIVQFAELGEPVRFDELVVPLPSARSLEQPSVMLTIKTASETVAQSDPCQVRVVAEDYALHCEFPSAVQLMAGHNTMEIVRFGEMKDATLMAVVHPLSKRELRVKIDDGVIPGVLGMRGYATVPPDSYQRLLDGAIGSYTVSEPEPGMTLIENTRVGGSAYYVSSLDGRPDAEYEQVRMTFYDETSMQFEYSGSRPGWIVIPVRSYPGWSLTYNGEPVEPGLFLGVMPAVPVNGKGKISFCYRPTQYVLPGIVSLAGFLLMIVMILRADRLNRWFQEAESNVSG
ncbi:MAG: hypothetical protein KZQ95_05240 [Candidatus Thiodiazotropha sp. (ex Epidulcina cf. delphinae)]|nr:hypothetical protein [Candidatus Thiodiazotropha sp. (ex Epidulcina cf. delphinae)]